MIEVFIKYILVGLYIAVFASSCANNQSDSREGNVNLVVVTQEPRFDHLTWKIEAAYGSWYYEIEHLQTGEVSTGFNSAIDKEGNDWIANNCEGRREWRGWPNFGPDGFGHPCRGGGGFSQWVDEKNNRIEFDGYLEDEHLILESWNDNYKVRYHFFYSHIAIEVIEADEPYAFLWEGPVAGKMNIDQQHYVLEDGQKREFAHGMGLGYLDPEFNRNFHSPFFYFLDDSASHVVYIGVKNQSEGGDEGWAQPDNMIIFSFGREDDDHALTGIDAIAVFGFLDKSIGHEEMKSLIYSHLNEPF